jgi:DNA-binding NarL/FixJ family response regulator
VTGLVRVVVVDDQAVIRGGLRLIVDNEPDLTVVGEAGDGDEAVRVVAAASPQVVLMDIRMPGSDGIDATRRILDAGGDDAPSVLVLTTFQDDDYVFGALRAGASGFLLKDTPPTEIVHAVRLVAAGEAMLSPAVTRRLIEHFSDGTAAARRTAAQAALRSLSDREREVAVEVGRGRSNAEIATRLYMSEATVKSHVSRLLTKLHAGNRVQIAILVHDAGLV